MRRYHKLHSTFWEDDKVRALLPAEICDVVDAQKLFAYVQSNRHSNLLGIYVLRPGYACEDLRVTREAVLKGLRLLKPMVEYDEATEVILVRNHLRYNPVTSTKQFDSVRQIMGDLPQSPLVGRAVDGLEELLAKYRGNPKTKDIVKPLEKLVAELRNGLQIGLPIGLSPTGGKDYRKDYGKDERLGEGEGEGEEVGVEVGGKARRKTPNGKEQVPPGTGEEIRRYFNAKGCFTECRKLTAALQDKLAARWQDRDFREHWREAIDRAVQSSWMRAEHKRNRSWRLTLEWLLRNDANYSRLLAGEFDDERGERHGRGDF